MSKYMEALFSGSPFLFKVLSLPLLVFGLLMPFVIQTNDLITSIIKHVMCVTCILLVLVLYSVSKFWWAARIITAVFVLGTISYFTAMLIDVLSNGVPIKHEENSANLFNATLLLIGVGYPSLVYTILGRITWIKKDEVDDDIIDDCDLNDLEDEDESYNK